MAPCCRLYGWLGVKLKKAEREREKERREEEEEESAKENPFAAWIETYSSLEYHAATAKLEALLDRLAEGLSAEERGEFFFFFSVEFLVNFFTFRDESGGGEKRFLASNSNDALAACCGCFFSEQKQQHQQQHIAEKPRHAPGVCSRRRPHSKGKRRRGKGIGVVVAAVAG